MAMVSLEWTRDDAAPFISASSPERQSSRTSVEVAEPELPLLLMFVVVRDG